MSVAVLERSYSEVVVNVIMDLVLNWKLFSDVGRPLSFVNMEHLVLPAICVA